MEEHNLEDMIEALDIEDIAFKLRDNKFIYGPVDDGKYSIDKDDKHIIYFNPIHDELEVMEEYLANELKITYKPKDLKRFINYVVFNLKYD